MASFPWEWSFRVGICSVLCLSAALSLGAWRQRHSSERQVLEEVGIRNGGGSTSRAGVLSDQSKLYLRL